MSRSPAAALTRRRGWRAEITRYQWLVLLSTTLAWGLDGFAGSLYSLVIGPTMTDLLPHSGIPVDAASIGLYGGFTIMVYLIGWATGGIVLGMLADHIGRVRVLSVGIITYAVFSAVAALAENWWQLGILRFVAGIGSGVEGPVGAALVFEAWRNRFRTRACGVMMSGYAGGFFLAAVVYSLLGQYGWRVMFGVTIAPALLVLFIRRHLHDSDELTELRRARAERRARGARAVEDRYAIHRLLTPPIRRRTIICTLIASGSLISFWSVSTWTPQIIRQLAAADGLTGNAVDHRVSVALMAFNAGGIVGYASWGFLADWLGRRAAFTISFVTAGTSVACLYPFSHSFATYLGVLPVVGFGLFGALSGNFVYFPEVFVSEVRATGIALANSLGRYVTAVGPLAVGVGSAAWFAGNLGRAAAIMSAFAVVGLIGVALTPKTRGHAVPGTIG